MSTFRMELYHGEAYARDVELLPDETILSALRRAGVTELETPCGGNGTCKQCRVLLEQEEVLACQSAPGCDCRVTLPGTGEAVIETGGVVDIMPSEEGLGLAVDIGTTTVAVFLYNLGSGRLLGIESGRNAQRPFGADVISRIQHCSEEGGLEALRGAICAQLDASIDRLCARTGQKRGRIRSIAVAGNTVMEHIFDGLSPVSIGVAPFATLSLFDDCRPASVFFSGLAPDCEVYLCPALAGYVGGDITAGLYSSGASDSGKKVLYLDIGTNGEMGIGVSGDFLCCATR